MVSCDRMRAHNNHRELVGRENCEYPCNFVFSQLVKEGHVRARAETITSDRTQNTPVQPRVSNASSLRDVIQRSRRSRR